MIGTVTEQAKARDHHVQSTVDQMLHLGSNEHFGCSGKGLCHVGTISPVACMQKYVRLPEVLSILATERASNYVRLDETITDKVR